MVGSRGHLSRASQMSGAGQIAEAGQMPWGVARLAGGITCPGWIKDSARVDGRGRSLAAGGLMARDYSICTERQRRAFFSRINCERGANSVVLGSAARLGPAGDCTRSVVKSKSKAGSAATLIAFNRCSGSHGRCGSRQVRPKGAAEGCGQTVRSDCAVRLCSQIVQSDCGAIKTLVR